MPGLLDMERLVINQKAKLIELTNEYKVLDEAGNQVGAIRQEGQSTAKKLLRAVSRFDQFMSHTLAVYENDGSKVLELTRPRTMWKSTVEVRSGPETVAGRIRQQNVIGKIRFALEDADGTPVGELRAENWRAWDFHIVDTNDQLMGRITKKWAGFGREMFTTADNYVVEINPACQGTLRYLVLGAGAAVDTVLKQDQG